MSTDALRFPGLSERMRARLAPLDPVIGTLCAFVRGLGDDLVVYVSPDDAGGLEAETVPRAILLEVLDLAAAAGQWPERTIRDALRVPPAIGGVHVFIHIAEGMALSVRYRMPARPKAQA